MAFNNNEPDDLGQLLSGGAANPIVVDWDAVLARSIVHPGEVLSRSSCSSNGPLAWLLSRDPPLRVVKSLLSRFRDEICLRPRSRPAGRGGDTTALHQACTLSFTRDDIALTILAAHPAAAQSPNRYGSLPLHCARSDVVAAALIQAYPEALGIRNKGGNFPVHLAAYNASPEHLRLLLEEGTKMGVGEDENSGQGGGVGRGCGGVLIRNNVGETPFELVIFRLELSLEWDGPCRVRTVGAGESVENQSSQGDEWNWEKFCLVLRAASPSSVIDHDDDGGLLALHAALSMRCSDKAVCRALMKYPEQLRVRDRNGDLPLHLALASTSSARVVRWLLDPLIGYPDAALAPDIRRGRFPLHIAVTNGRGYHDGLTELLLADGAEALETRDVATGLYPFMMPPRDGGGGLKSLELSYRLLRECPHLVLRR